MRTIISTNGIVNSSYPGQGLSDITKSGFDTVAIGENFIRESIYIERELTKNLGAGKTRAELTFEQRKEKIGMIKKRGLVPIVVSSPHLPALSLVSCNNVERINETLIECAQNAIITAINEKAKYVIIKPLPFATKEENDFYYRDLHLFLNKEKRDGDIMILLENQVKNVNGHLIRGMYHDGYTLASTIDKLNDEVGYEAFGATMDVGACNICGINMQEFIQELGARLKIVKVRECDGHSDNYLMPFTSIDHGEQTDWIKFFRGLRDISFDGILLFDFSDTISTFSPMLRSGLLIFMKQIADYFVWQIEMEKKIMASDSIVLFGAGNMCRNYLKSYGNEKMPLYTCDNNSSLWGTTFEGLEIKNPDELLNLPENTTIFICNVYYREIQEQLKNMGIKNRIEFFNDEYPALISMDTIY